MRAEQMRAHQEVSCAKTRFDPGRAWSLGFFGPHAASPRPGLSIFFHRICRLRYWVPPRITAATVENALELTTEGMPSLR